MSQKTLSTMHDARDAEDKRLLEAGEHKLLLAGYFTPVRDRCFFRLGSRDAGDEAAQRVFLRLWHELQSGKIYRVPFRVVVWMVTEWTLRGFHAGPSEVELPDEWDAEGSDAYAEWEADHDLAALFRDLPQRQRQVLDLRYRLGLTPAGSPWSWGSSQMQYTRRSITATRSSERSSVSSHLFELFDEYAAAYVRGDRPDSDDYLSRAGEEQEQLASLLDEFLRRTPAPMPTEDDVRLLGLMLVNEPPLLRLRVRSGIKVDDVVSAVIERLRLDPAKTPKVKRYYQRLEGGLLDPGGVSNRVRVVLDDLFGASVDSAMSWTAQPVAPSTAFLRRSEDVEAAPSAPAPAAAEDDEIDRLFTGGESA